MLSRVARSRLRAGARCHPRQGSTRTSWGELEGSLAVCGGHLTPELRLHLLTPACPLYSAPAPPQDHPLTRAGDPWWAVYWPGGQVLARALLDHPALARGRRLLDLGSGCGAVSIAALLAGARAVTANDIDVTAETVLRANCELNNVGSSDQQKIAFSAANFLTEDSGCEEMLRDVDLILIGDMFYDQEIGEAVLKLCERFKQLGSGKEVLLGDPGRWFLQSSSPTIQAMFTPVAKYSLTPETRRENYGFHHGIVWKTK